MSEYSRQELRYVSLPQLVRQAESGQLRPGAFSRPQAWNRTQVVNLFDSIFHDYPIGAILVVDQPVPEEEFLLGTMHVLAPSGRAWMIIDGLQRVTAIVSALTARQSQYDGSQFDIFFDPKRQEFVGADIARSDYLPLHIAANREMLDDWLEEHPAQRGSEADACRRLFGILSSYQVPMIRLEGEDVRDTAYEIFTRLNVAGASLTKSDLARARSSHLENTYTGLRRLQLEAERLGFGRLPIELAAECAMSALSARGDVEFRQSARATAIEKFEQLPDSLQHLAAAGALSAIIPTIQFLSREASIPHIKLLPQSSNLAELVRFVSLYGAPTGRIQELLRRWVWRSGTVGRSSVRLLRDTNEIPVDAISYAERLLASLSPAEGFAWRPDVNALALSKANGRLNTLALLAQFPALLVGTDSEPEITDEIGSDELQISSPRIMIPWLDSASSAFRPFLPIGVATGRRPSLGARLLHPQAGRRELWDYITSATPDSLGKLTTHYIDEDALTFLRSGRFDVFIEYRDDLMAGIIQRHVQSRARWGFRDHGSLPHISDAPYGDEYRDEY